MVSFCDEQDKKSIPLQVYSAHRVMFDGMPDLWKKSFQKEFEGKLRYTDSAEMRRRMASDHTEDLIFMPGMVVEPSSTHEVQQVMKWAHANDVPVTPAGAMTGLSGGALPVEGGISLSTRRLNRIVTIDERNHQVVVEPGVIVQEMQEAVQARGLFTLWIRRRAAVAPLAETLPRIVVVLVQSNTVSLRIGCSTWRSCLWTVR